MSPGAGSYPWPRRAGRVGTPRPPGSPARGEARQVFQVFLDEHAAVGNGAPPAVGALNRLIAPLQQVTEDQPQLAPHGPALGFAQVLHLLGQVLDIERRPVLASQGLGLLLRPGSIEIGVIAGTYGLLWRLPAPRPGRVRVLLQLLKVIGIAHIRRERRHLRIPLAHELGVDHDVAHVHVGQQPLIAIPLLDIELQADGSALDQRPVGLGRFGATGLLASGGCMVSGVVTPI